MGTRADFYIGGRYDRKMKWLGSIGWDGYPDGIPDGIKDAKTAQDYLHNLQGFSLVRNDWTPPEQGWPWPWEDSNTTDYAYIFDDGKVWASEFGSPWFDAKSPPKEPDDLRGKKPAFPDMTAIQRVTFGPRSGVVVLGGQPEERLDPPGSAIEIRGEPGVEPEYDPSVAIQSASVVTLGGDVRWPFLQSCE